MPRCFKLDNGLLPSGSIEGCHGKLYLHPDCLILAMGCSSWGMDLAMHVSGKFVRGLVLLGSTA